MMRTLNFLCIAVMGLACLGLYHIAEEARVSEAELRAAKNAIRRESEALTVLGAEWTRVTQPARIHALAGKHLSYSGKPLVQLSSLTQLPRKGESEGQILTAKAGKPAQRKVAFAPARSGDRP
jgi:hypothetical protein